jgi:hypothetical protein
MVNFQGVAVGVSVLGKGVGDSVGGTISVGDGVSVFGAGVLDGEGVSVALGVVLAGPVGEAVNVRVAVLGTHRRCPLTMTVELRQLPCCNWAALMPYRPLMRNSVSPGWTM